MQAVIISNQRQSSEYCLHNKCLEQSYKDEKKGEPIFSFHMDQAAYIDEAKARGILLGGLFSEHDVIPDIFKYSFSEIWGESVAKGNGESEEESISDNVDSEIGISHRVRKLDPNPGVDSMRAFSPGQNCRIIEGDMDGAFSSKGILTSLAAELSKNEGSFLGVNNV